MFLTTYIAVMVYYKKSKRIGMKIRKYSRYNI